MMSTPPHTRPARLTVALVLLGGLLTPSVRAQPAPRAAGVEGDVVPHVAVYTAGVDGYHTYRIPSVIATPSGALLAFTEGRRAGRGDAGDIDLVMKWSDDRGRTWSAMTVIGDNGPNTFGNPCPLVDRTTGVIWLLTRQNRGDDGERAIIDGTSTASRTVWVMTSADDGRTWSAPADITAQAKRADWTWYATGPGIGIQTASGRLVIPANHAVARSKMHRSHLLSDDDGRTWPTRRLLHDGPAAYSALVALPGDEVGVLYERGTDSPYDGIAFARVSLAWLAAQE